MFGFRPPVYQCNGYSSSYSPFLCVCVSFIYICICRLLRFTNVMVSGSSSHHHSSIWCPPTHQPTIGKTSHIFCHKFQIQLKKEIPFINLLLVHRLRSQQRGNSGANLQKTNFGKMTKEKKRLASEREMANVHFHFAGQGRKRPQLIHKKNERRLFDGKLIGGRIREASHLSYFSSSHMN